MVTNAPPIATRARQRIVPLARLWSKAGFDPATADSWRSAGWVDADKGAQWHQADPSASPRALLRLADLGYSPSQLSRVRDLAPVGAPAWTRVLLPLRDDDGDDGSLHLWDEVLRAVEAGRPTPGEDQTSESAQAACSSA